MKNVYANLDNLVDDLKVVLLKNRSSLSVPDVEILEKVIISLENLKEIQEISDRKLILSDILLDLLKLFKDPAIIFIIERLIESFEVL